MSVESEFRAMKALFGVWAKTGVPTGIRYPRSQSGAVGWSCAQFGIKGVGSRREFNTTHPRYGTIVREIRSLIAQLKPVEEVGRPKHGSSTAASSTGTKKRTYRTQKARRLAAEADAAHHRATLENTLIQLQATRQTLVSLERDLKVEHQRTAELKRENAKLEGDNAQLRQMLAMKSGILRLVD